MSIIDEIRKERMNLLTNEQKEKLLSCIKKQLVNSDYAIVDGAYHYYAQEWKYSEAGYCKAPFALHSAIKEWLQTLGFHTSRYYNGYGVDNGLKVWF